MNTSSRTTGTQKSGTRRKKPATIDLKAKEVTEKAESASSQARTGRTQKTENSQPEASLGRAGSKTTAAKEKPGDQNGQTSKGKSGVAESEKGRGSEINLSGIDQKSVVSGLIGAAVAVLGLGLIGQFGSAGKIPLIGSLYAGASTEQNGQTDDLRLNDLEAQLNELKAQGTPSTISTEEFTGRLAEVESRIAALNETFDSMASATDRNSEASSPEINAAITSIGTRLEDLEKSFTSLSNSGTASTTGAGNRISGLEAQLNTRLAEVEAGISEIRETTSANSQKIQSMTEQASTLETTVAAVKASETVARTVAINALGTALDNDDSILPSLTSIESLGGNSKELERLKELANTGIPTRKNLLEELAVFTDSIQNPENDSSSGTVADRFWANARNLVSFRSSGPQPGDRPVAILSRVTANLKDGNLLRAAEEWQGLPEEVRQRGASWSEKLDKRREAFALFETLSSQFDASSG